MSGLHAGDGEMFINGKKVADLSSFKITGPLSMEGSYPEPKISFLKDFNCKVTGGLLSAIVLPPHLLEPLIDETLGAAEAGERMSASLRLMGEARLREILDEHFGLT